MKKYLVIFGAMVLGAVLMFGFTHTHEVQAGNAGDFSCSDSNPGYLPGKLYHCKSQTVECVIIQPAHNEGAISCVKK